MMETHNGHIATAVQQETKIRGAIYNGDVPSIRPAENEVSRAQKREVTIDGGSFGFDSCGAINQAARQMRAGELPDERR